MEQGIQAITIKPGPSSFVRFYYPTSFHWERGLAAPRQPINSRADLFNNLDNTTADIFPQIWTKYKKGSDETPLHVIERIIAPVRIQTAIAMYWARMAFVDIGHPKAQAAFNSQRKNLNYANLDSQGNGRYRVKSTRRPRYMGANIIPLKGTGIIAANVTADMPFTSTLVIKAANGMVRYISMPGGSGQANVASGEEAMLVVVNTPAKLILFDPFKLSTEANTGVDYQLQLTGATA